MTERHLIYRNARWNVRVSVYMAFQGAALLGAGPALLVGVVIEDETVAVTLMATLLVGGALLPFVRTLLGRVIVDRGDVVVVNPFRTVRVPLERVTGFGDVPLQQGFFIVAALQIEDPGLRLLKVIPVPGTDGPMLEQLLTTA